MNDNIKRNFHVLMLVLGVVGVAVFVADYSCEQNTGEQCAFGIKMEEEVK